MTNHTDVDELRAEIVRTRADLGETAAALAAKTDVKARLGDTVHDVRERALHQAEHVAEQAGTVVGSMRAQAADVAHRTPRRAIPIALVVVAAGAAAVITVLIRRR